MSLVIADGITKTYGTGNSAVVALSGLSFQIEAGEFVSIMGESGSGKSTLLSIMGGLNTPTAGSYFVDGIDVYNLSPEQRADLRREYVGFVFQSFHLVPYLTVMENALLPLTTAPGGRGAKVARAAQALESVGMISKAKRLPDQISGGEQERVAIARAVVNSPPLLLADEPTGNLDARNSLEVMHLLQRLNRSGATIVMVTHSERFARFAHRTLHLTDGRSVDGSGAAALHPFAHGAATAGKIRPGVR